MPFALVYVSVTAISASQPGSQRRQLVDADVAAVVVQVEVAAVALARHCTGDRAEVVGDDVVERARAGRCWPHGVGERARHPRVGDQFADPVRLSERSTTSGFPPSPSHESTGRST